MSESRILSPYITETSISGKSYNLHIVYAVGEGQEEEANREFNQLYPLVYQAVEQNEDVVEISQNCTEVEIDGEKDAPAHSLHVMSNAKRDLQNAVKAIIQEGFKLDKTIEELDAQIEKLKIVPEFNVRFTNNANVFKPEIKPDGFVLTLSFSCKNGADYEDDVSLIIKKMYGSAAAKKAEKHGFIISKDTPIQVSDGNNYHHVTISAITANGVTALLKDLQQEFGITYNRGLQEIFFDARKVENSLLASQRVA